MLGKLLKYEFKSTIRLFLPLYIGLLFITLINKVFLMIGLGKNDNPLLILPSFLTFSVYGLIIFAIFAVAFVVNIYRFYKNLITDEGYLMFTLPVTATQNILSKFLISIFWNLIGLVLVAISVIILLASKTFFSDLAYIYNMISKEIYTEIGFNAMLFLLEMALLYIVGLFFSILLIYVSIAVGQMLFKNKLLGSIGVFFIIYVILQIFSTVITLAFMFSSKSFITETIQANFFHAIMLSEAVIFFILSAVFFFVTRYILTKKLNLA